MKNFLSLSVVVVCAQILCAQTYPDPEFSNEVYYLKKENPYSLVRLEKNISKQGTKTKMGGYAGVEYGYTIEGGKSSVRFSSGNNLSFIFSTGISSASSNSQSDSVMKANGMDPNSLSGFGGSDPSSTITLYKLDVDKGERKIYLMKSGGAFSFGKKTNQSSNKYTFSLKKIREGYWELVIDKPLPKGEYAFSMTGAMGSQDMTGSQTVFAFGVD